MAVEPTGAVAWYAAVFNRTPQALQRVDVAAGRGESLPASVTLHFGDGRVLRYALTIGPQGDAVGLRRVGDGR